MGRASGFAASLILNSLPFDVRADRSGSLATEQAVLRRRYQGDINEFQSKQKNERLTAQKRGTGPGLAGFKSARGKERERGGLCC